jgi:hypothetical protein
MRLESQTFEPAIERPGAQLRYAEASCELDCAEMLLRKNLAEIRPWGEGKPVTPLDRAEIRRNTVYGAKLVTQATNRLVDGIDSSGLRLESHINRQAADTRAAGLQVVLHWEETAIQYSRVLWGMDPHTVLL